MLTKKIPNALQGNYRTIDLNKRQVTFVSADKYFWLMNWRWRLRRSGHCFYATRRIKQNGKETIIKMHRQIMRPAPGMEVHHINRNTLDNRTENLRIVSPEQHKQIHAMG